MRSLPETVLAYRPDIDGLRAIAVVAVILFHAGIPGFHGGYVGVDVFFVISGYLITGWLVKRGSGSWSQVLREFYVRRGRRILPAFIGVLAVTTLGAVWLLQAVHLEIFGRFLATGAVMLANVGARFNGNYFGWTASDMPLLHLWSIAVEEQFYLLYPLVFLALTRWLPRQRDRLLLAAALASFLLCTWAVRTHPVANYFFLPTRAWELLVGASVALGVWPRLRSRPLREAVAALAFAAVVASAIFFTPLFSYPSWPTLVPCVATAALISAGSDGSAITRVLSLRPLVFTGLISYSLYLWHMPVLGLYRYFNIFALRPLELVCLLGIIYSLSAATWRWIELPFRRRQWIAGDGRFWQSAAAASAILCAIGVTLVIHYSHGRRAEMADDAPQRDGDLREFPRRCIGKDFGNIRRGELCSFGPAAGTPVLVWGDSHSWALAPAWRRLSNELGLRLYIAQVPRCPPLIGAVDDPRCTQFNRAMLDAIAVIQPRGIVLNARWGNPDLRLAASPDLTVANGDSLFSRGLQETLRRVSAPGRSICVVKAVPAIGYAVDYALHMARRRGIDTSFLSLSREAAYGQDRDRDADIDALAQRGLVRTVDAKAALCDGPRCRYVGEGGVSLYRDDNHVSAAGAALLHDEVAQCFDGLGRTQRPRSLSATAKTASGE